MNNLYKTLKKISIPIIVLLIASSCSNKDVKQRVPVIPVVEVLQQDVPIYEDFIGQVYGQKDIPIRARVSGFLDGLYFKEGTWVQENELLYLVDQSSFLAEVAQAKSNLAGAETQLAKAQSDLGRIKPLAKINAVSQSDLDATQAEYDAAIANVQANKSSVEIANINLSYCKIHSPIRGLIGKTQAKVGEYVGQSPNPVILNTVSIIDTVHVEFYLTESDYLGLARHFIENERKKIDHIYLNNADRARNLSLILSDGTTFAYKGSVNFIDREINATTGSLMIQTKFANPDYLLRPGQFAKVRAKMHEIENALLVPQRCIIELQGTHSLFVVSDSSTIENKQVKVGPKYGEYWIIEEGIKAGDKVVIDALQKVKSGMKITPKVTEFKPQNNEQNNETNG